MRTAAFGSCERCHGGRCLLVGSSSSPSLNAYWTRLRSITRSGQLDGALALTDAGVVGRIGAGIITYDS